MSKRQRRRHRGNGAPRGQQPAGQAAGGAGSRPAGVPKRRKHPLKFAPVHAAAHEADARPSRPAGQRPNGIARSHADGSGIDFRSRDVDPSEGGGREDERSRPPVYAALDLGTNNCRLLVATPTRPGQFRVVDAFSRIVRLGEGLGRTGRLASGAMDRALAALSICAQKLAARDVAGARLIATEACRSAANGEEFIERVERETGLRLEIVSRETEARLAVSGCGSLIDRGAKGAVLFDIGGGSTEIALLDLRHTNPRRLSNAIVA